MTKLEQLDQQIAELKKQKEIEELKIEIEKIKKTKIEETIIERRTIIEDYLTNPYLTYPVTVSSGTGTDDIIGFGYL